VKWNGGVLAIAPFTLNAGVAISPNVALSTFNEESFKIGSIHNIKCQLGKFSQALLIPREREHV
jgi:hypothetical protein